MLIALAVLAAAFAAGLTLSSYLAALYVEALRLRPHPTARALAYSDEHLLPRLKLEEPEGVRRFSMVRQAALVALALDLVLLIEAGDGIALASATGLNPIALTEALILVFAALGLFGHILPTVLMTRTDGRWATAFVWVAKILLLGVWPLLVLIGFARSIVELGGPREEPATVGNGGHEIDALLDAGQEEGLIGEEDRKLIQSVVDFGDKTVREVMTPRPRIVAIDAEETVEALRKMQLEEEYSRIPVYSGSIDHIVGFVHSRDTLEVDKDARASMKTRELARPLMLVPETKPIHELMRELQGQNAQMAVVVDEYGQTAGLATMEDLMEEIVGEIRDETEPDHDVIEYPDQSFVSSGNLDLDRLEDLVGFRPDDGVESTTVGGLVCEQLGQVPDPGARLRLDGIEIEVLSADERRVRSVRVRRAEPEPAEVEEGIES